MDATPNDAVQRGGIWLGGGSPPHRNLLDFIGADIDNSGRIVVGYADGCTGAACVQAPDTATGNSYTSVASIARQTGGKGLFANADATTNLIVPGAPSVTVGRNGSVASITLSEPDNGGSAITSYKIMRGTASGAETLLTTVSGSQVSYNDMTADANTVYFYKVVAVNAQGESCGINEVISKPIGSSCTDMKIVTDAAGDQKGAPLTNGDLDIQSISMAEPYFADNSSKLVFKLKISDPALQANRQWRILWNYPIRSANIADSSYTGTYYVGMNTDVNGARSFEYGTVTTVEAVPANTSSPNRIGAADSGSSFDSTTGIITIVLDPIKVGSPKAGDIIGKLVARTFDGNGNTTVLSTSAVDGTSITGTLDPYTAGSYALVGNLACNTAPTAAITSPANNAVFSSGSNITVTANASDSDGRISNLDIYVGNTIIGSSAGSPFSVLWSNVPAGSYALTAKATDNAGATTTSAVVNITVNIPPPAAPSNLTANAINNSGANKSVVWLNWADNSSNEDSFIIERSTTSATAGFTQLAVTSANTTAFTDSTVVSKKTYYYRVRARNTSGDSPVSTAAKVTVK